MRRKSPAGGSPREAGAERLLGWFSRMIDHNLAHARRARRAGRPLVGIACEYTPREIILAAGGVPVCLCGGAAETIPEAEKTLPANLCPLIKSTFGYSVLRQNPFLEMADLVVAETTCDGKKKMYERLALDRTVHLLELPQEPDRPAALRHWRDELHRLGDALQSRWGHRITDAGLRAAIRVMNRERRLRRDLAGLMRAEAPPLTGRELLETRSLIAGIPEYLARYERALRVLPGRRLRPAAAGRVRVLLTGVPIPHGAERVLEIIEGHGGLVVVQENCTGLKPVLEDVDESARDPWRAIAEKYLHLPCSVMTPNRRRFDSLRRLAEEYRPEAVVELIWQACLTYDIESRRVQAMVEGDWGLPYLRIETDFSPSDTARLVTRVEALFETARGRRPPRR